MPEEKNKIEKAWARINRRGFVRWSALAGGFLLAADALGSYLIKRDTGDQSPQSTIKIIRTGCPGHNCGGRCLLKVHVKDGLITRIETDDRPGDDISDPQLRACIRGRSYRKRQYNPDRLKYPLRRIGKRGEGKFERISWEDALELMVGQISKIKEQYGNSAIYVPYGTGSYTNTNGRWTAARLMNLIGGCLGYYNSYSWA